MPKGVKFAHVKLCGILNKLGQVKILLIHCILNVKAVTESKFNHHSSDSEIYSNKKRPKSTWRGVDLFINDKWAVLKVYKDNAL